MSLEGRTWWVDTAWYGPKRYENLPVQASAHSISGFSPFISDYGLYRKVALMVCPMQGIGVQCALHLSYTGLSVVRVLR